MKTVLVLSILFSAIALPVRAELTETDLENIRQIFREEWEEAIRDIHVPLDGMPTTFDEIDASFDSINQDLERIQIMPWVATALVVVAGIVNWTYVVKLWRSR